MRSFCHFKSVVGVPAFVHHAKFGVLLPAKKFYVPQVFFVEISIISSRSLQGQKRYYGNTSEVLTL